MELMPGYKRSDVGVIPEDWDVGAIGDAFEIRNQLRQPISQSVRERMVGPYPYYGPTSVQGWINEYRIEGEHALIGEDGDHFLKWRDQAMTLLVTGRFNVNNHAHIVRGTNNLTSWFYWFFANRDITSYLTRQGAGRYKLTKATLEKLPCAIPPLDEQRAIAQALSDVDALLATLDQVIVKKRDLKQAAMQQLLTGKTRLPGFSGEWEVKRLGNVLRFQVGFPFSSAFFNEKEKGFRLVKNRDLKTDDQVFHYSGPYDSAFLVKNGDVLVGMDGDFLPCLWKKGMALLNQRVGRIVPLAGLNLQFAYYYLLEPLKEIEIATASTTVKHLSHGDIEGIERSLPTVPEQTAIAEVLSRMDAELATLEQRRDKTRNLKQAMMQELLTGKTRLV